MSMPKKTALLLAVLTACLTQVSSAGEWHIIDEGLQYRKQLYADSALGWSVTTIVDTVSWDIDDCIYRTNDGGRSWIPLTAVGNYLMNTYYFDLSYKQGIFFAAQVGYDIGGGGAPVSCIIASSDFGSFFNTQGGAYIQPDRVTRLSVLDTLNVWVIADSCYKFGENEWISRSRLPLDYVGPNKKIVFVDTSLGYVANLENGIVYRSVDGGFSWDTLAQWEQSSDFIADTKNLWLLSATLLWHATDSGATWTACDPGQGYSMNCISSFDSMNLWVGCDNGVVAHTADGGQSWMRDSIGTSAAVVSIFALSNNYVWVSTADSTLWGLGVTGISGHDAPQIAVTPAFLKAYPNPSHGRLTVQYSVSRPGQGSVCVYDITGRLVKTLSNGPQIKGGHSINWDWRREGRGISSGVYFIKSIIAGNSAVEKIVLVK